MDIHETIRTEREKRRYSQVDMAKMLEISPSAYLQIEKGKTALTLTRLYQLAEVFKLPVEVLLGITIKLDSALLERVRTLEKANEDLKQTKQINEELEQINQRYKLLHTKYLNKLQYLYIEIIRRVQTVIIETAILNSILTKEEYEDWLRVEEIRDVGFTYVIEVDLVEARNLDPDEFLLSHFMTESKIYECLCIRSEPIIKDLQMLHGYGLIEDKGLERAFMKLIRKKHFPERNERNQKE